MTKISLLGCGWLGFQLAKKLLENGNFVSGSTTSEDKLLVLEKAKIKSFLIEIDDKKLMNKTAMTDFLGQSEILIIAIPPKLRRKESVSESDFVEKIKSIIPFIEKSEVKKVLFVSSTSVYGIEEKDSILTEKSDLKPVTESAKQLVEVESLLQTNPNFKTTVLRFGGLIGEDRNPITVLTRKVSIENPIAPINLIHQDDCIGIILKLLEKDSWGEIWNGVAPYHPSRAVYYTQQAIQRGLPLPKFASDSVSTGKVISSEKLMRVLNYTFVKDTL